MLIDWFTVGAQALNFLVLVWLLKRFLYKPVLDAIQQREDRIASQYADADAKRKDAEMEHDEFRQKNEAFDRDRATLLGKAKEDAQAGGKVLLDAAAAEADQMLARRTAAMRTDTESLHRELGAMAQGEVWAIAGQTLSYLASSSLEDRMADVFLRRMREMDATSKAGFTKAIADGPEPTILATAFDLSEPRRALIQSAFQETFATGKTLLFETRPALIGGFELSTNGQKLTWSIEAHLAALEQNLRDRLEADSSGAPDADLAASPPENRT